MKRIRCAGLALLLAVSGCAVGPNYHRPATKVPEKWGGPANEGNTAYLTQWWTTLKDPTLDSLIQRAVDANLDIQIAEARVREARAARGWTLADFLPMANTTAKYSHAQIRKPASTGNTGGVVGTLIGAVFVGNKTNIKRQVDLFQTGFDASWEIDVFGGKRRAAEAAKADLEAAQSGRDDVMVSLLAEVARNYLELRGAQGRLDIAESNLRGQEDTLQLTRTRYDAGLVSELDVKRAEAQLETTQSQIPNLQTAMWRSVHHLSILLGQEPNALAEELSNPADLPIAPPEIPAGLPSELLQRRPDIRVAERQLAAATAHIGEATADWFPKFSLTGTFGAESGRFDALNLGKNRVWSYGPSVDWAILNAPRIWSNVKLQNARQEQALHQYQKIVLTALEETENSLVAYTNEQQRYTSLTKAADANRRAVSMANELYTKGLVDFLNVLDGQRSLYEAEDQLMQSRTTVLTNLVALYKVLGGGWDSFPMQTKSAKSEKKTG
ncbi:MAG TPA: efflux transporter outer membrane subunit [Candidatus Hydrogenedentes bacterium]|nr:efflux transporter outer membrane subunit [Candidatus Hydrogenedentota bacterium]